jgi:hypothetical protein
MSGGSSTSKSESQSKTAAQFTQIDKLIGMYGGLMGQNEKVYQGDRVSPLTDIQQTAITGAGNYGDYLSTPQQAGTPLFNETGQATRDLLAGDRGASKFTDQDISSYFSGKYYQPAMTSLKKDINPMIDEAYAGPGFFGSGRSQARVKASQDVNDRLAGQWADLNWNALQQNQALDEASANRSLSTLDPAMRFGQVPAQEIQNNLQIAAQQIGGLGEIFKFGQADQSQAQAELESEIMKFAEENNLTDPGDLAIMLTLLGMNFQTSKGSSSSWNAGFAFN